MKVVKILEYACKFRLYPNKEQESLIFPRKVLQSKKKKKEEVALWQL